MEQARKRPGGHPGRQQSAGFVGAAANLSVTQLGDLGKCFGLSANLAHLLGKRAAHTGQRRDAYLAALALDLAHNIAAEREREAVAS